jgi:hypothetical protein
MPARAAVAVAWLVPLVSACAPRPLIERAIDARGGPLRTLVRQVEATVNVGFPGVWQGRTVFLVPDHYALTIVTATEADHYLFDGVTMRAFIGPEPVAVGRDRAPPLRTFARFTAITNLDSLLLPGAVVAPLPAKELPADAAAGIAVVLADDGSRYRLAFDERLLLVWASGPLDFPPLGHGEVVARFSDFHRRAGLWLPFHAEYGSAGRALMAERVLGVCPNDARVTPDSFRAPALLPECAPS